MCWMFQPVGLHRSLALGQVRQLDRMLLWIQPLERCFNVDSGVRSLGHQGLWGLCRHVIVLPFKACTLVHTIFFIKLATTGIFIWVHCRIIEHGPIHWLKQRHNHFCLPQPILFILIFNAALFSLWLYIGRSTITRWTYFPNAIEGIIPLVLRVGGIEQISFLSQSLKVNIFFWN